jgi:hypothetical protein
VDDVDGPRFFSLARRTFAFEGVMQARARREEDTPRRTPARPAATPPQQVAGSASNVVELAAFKATFPGLVSHNTEGR